MDSKKYFEELKKKKDDRVKSYKDNSEESFKEMLDTKEEAKDMVQDLRDTDIDDLDLRDDVKKMRLKEKALMKLGMNNKKDNKA